MTLVRHLVRAWQAAETLLLRRPALLPLILIVCAVAHASASAWTRPGGGMTPVLFGVTASVSLLLAATTTVTAVYTHAHRGTS